MRCCFKGQEGQLFEQAVLAGDVVGAGVALHKLVDEFWVNGLCHPVPLSLFQDDIYTKISKLLWSERFTVRVLADSGFDSDEFIDEVHNLGLHGVIGSRANRVIGPNKHLSANSPSGAVL